MKLRMLLRRAVTWSVSIASLALLAALLWHTLPGSPRAVIEGDRVVVWLSPDGVDLLTLERVGDEMRGPLRLWDTRTGEHVDEFLFQKPRIFQSARVWGVEVSPSGKYAVAIVPALEFVEIRTGRQWTSKFTESWDVDAVLLDPTERVLAGRNRHGAVALVDVSDGKVLDQFSDQRSFWHFTADGERFLFLVLQDQKFKMRVWNLQARKMQGEIGDLGWLRLPSPNGKMLLADDSGAAREGQLVLWDLATLKPRVRLDATDAAGNGYAFSSDSRVLAAWRIMNNVLEFWDTETGKRLAQSPIRGRCIAGEFSPDGRLFAFAQNDGGLKVTLFDVASAGVFWTRCWTLPPMGDCQLRFEGSRILAVSAVRWPGWPGPAELLNVQTGKTVVELTRVQKKNMRVFFHTALPTPDRRRLLFRESGEAVVSNVKSGRFASRRPKTKNREWEQLQVLDFGTGGEIMRLSNQHVRAAFLADDGRTLVTQHEHDIACWSAPPRPHWAGVVGPPLLAAFLISLIYFRARSAPTQH